MVVSLHVSSKAEPISAWFQGFNQAEWNHSRPERACNYIKSRLQHANRDQMLALLGKPDQQGEAGEGMWGHYDAYYSYVLDHDPNGKYPQDWHPYTWNTVDVSFAGNGTVSKIELRSHCY